MEKLVSTKQLTFLHCCDSIDITVGETTVMFGKHKYLITIHYCKSCGSEKATSNIKHLKEQNNEQ